MRICLLALLAPLPSLAATLSVGPNQRYTTLNDALIFARPGDTVELAPGSYIEDVHLSFDVQIVGTSGSTATELVFPNTGLTVDGATVQLTGLSLQGQSSRALDATLSDLTLTDVVIHDTPDGGAYLLDCAATFIDTHFQSNGANADYGGGLQLASSSIRLEDTHFEDNTAQVAGGGLYAFDCDLDGLVLDFSANISDRGGAASFDQSTVDWVEGHVSGNQGVTGGGVHLSNSVVLLDQLELVDNEVPIATGWGGGLYADGSELVGNALLFEGNTAYSGAALALEASRATLDDLTFSDNNGRVADAYSTTSDLEINDARLFAATRASAVVALGTGSLWMRQAHISTYQSTAPTLSIDDVNVELDDITMVDNSSFNPLIRITQSDSARIRRAYLCNNTVLTYLQAEQSQLTVTNSMLLDAGRFEAEGGEVQIHNNTLVESPSGPLLDLLDVSGAASNNLFYGAADYGIVLRTLQPFQLDYNAYADNSHGPVRGSHPIGSHAVTAPPQLTRYTSNHDCTDDQLWLQPGSPLIDAGDPSVLDPDGTPSDIGAYGGPDAPAAWFVDADGDGSPAGVDCDESDPAIHPAATEACDGVDNNCSGHVDDGLSYPDLDGDGYGDAAATGLQECGVASAGRSLDPSDCDDQDGARHPQALEGCVDGLDNDCDGVVDDSATPLATLHEDTDGDGEGRAVVAVDVCHPAPAGTVFDGRDCNDQVAYTNTYSPELECDGLDNDCNGVLVEGEVDRDADGFMVCDGDCNDRLATIYPGGPELCDGLDNNCDDAIDEGFDQQLLYFDADQDGFGDPNGPTLMACAPPPGYTDNNLDCNDRNPSVFPSAQEVCDDVDNDCNGQVDEDLVFQSYWRDRDRDGAGDPTSTPELLCRQPWNGIDNNLDCDDLDARRSPFLDEDCDKVDNDCDGVVDNGLPTSMYYQDADGDGFGDPLVAPVEACAQPDGHVGNNTDCDDRQATSHPEAPEVCDGLDNDCDGELHPDWQPYYLDEDGDGFGGPTARYACALTEGYSANADDCNDADASVHPDAIDTPADGIDNDCDGIDAVQAPQEAAGCGCSGTPRPASALWLLPLLAWRQRRT